MRVCVVGAAQACVCVRVCCSYVKCVDTIVIRNRLCCRWLCVRMYSMISMHSRVHTYIPGSGSAYTTVMLASTDICTRGELNFRVSPFSKKNVTSDVSMSLPNRVSA